MPLCSDTGNNRSPARRNSNFLASYNSNSNSNTYCGSGSLRHKRQHQPESNDSRAMNKVPAPGPGVQDKLGQKDPPHPSTLRNPGSFSMTAKLGESAPILKRTYITPAVPTRTQEPAAGAGGKKRNKLGYHRTSIACSHCRRRKIRCIVSSDIQNRCINCIRLKKDCGFCPVDQPLTVDSQGKPAGPGTGSSTAHSQFSSPALAFRQSLNMASGSMYGMGPKQDSNGHAASSIVPSSIGYPSVIGEGISMPIFSEQNFSVSTGTSLAGGAAELSSVTLPGSMDMGYEWCSYGSESDSTEQISPFAPGSTTSATWVTAMSRTPQFSDWNWNNGILPTTQAISVSFSGEVMSHPQHQFVPVSSKLPYIEAVPNMGKEYSHMITVRSCEDALGTRHAAASSHTQIEGKNAKM